MQEPDYDRELIDDILSTRHPITRSQEVADNPDDFAQWVDDTLSLNFDVINDRLWQEMEAELPRIRDQYEAYRRRYNSPMSFYVAKQGGMNDEKLFVLLLVERQDRPGFLWTFE